MNCVLSKGFSLLPSLKYGFNHGSILNRKILFYPIQSCSFSNSPICLRMKNTPSSIARRKALDIVDWLPFPWTRRPCHNPFVDSGDLVKVFEYDPSWPKPDFELSEELKTADDDVKRMFTLATASQREIREVVTRRTLERIQRHPNDFDSLEVQIALKTIQIRGLFEHQGLHKKDRRNGRKILDILIKKRNRLLKILRNIDMDRFQWICNEMKLTYTPEQLGGSHERQMYCRKWDLRRLTKEYCTNMIKEKKKAYHDELKQQQADFLKEKEEILAWIEKEEKELANLNIDE